MIESKQITITAPNGILNDFNEALIKANKKSKRKITKSGLFVNLMLKFIKKTNEQK